MPEETPVTTGSALSDDQKLAIKEMVREIREEKANAAPVVDRPEIEYNAPAFNKTGRGGDDKFSFSKVIRGLKENMGDDQFKKFAPFEHYAITTKATGEGTVGTGTAFTGAGVLVPVQYATDLIELIRAKTVVRQLGARSMPVSSETGFIPRQTGAATAAWIGEASSITASDPSFDQIQWIIRKLAAFVAVSNELLLDSNPDAETVVRQDLAEVIALAEDLAYISGSGTPPTPKGIINQTGVTSTSMGTNGATPTFDTLMSMVYDVVGANFQPNGLAINPRTAYMTLRQAKDSQNRYLWDPAAPQNGLPQTVAGIPFAMTTQIPINQTQGSASTASYMVMGQWDQALIFERGGLELMSSNVAGSAFQTDSTYVRAIVRRDFQVRHGAAFSVRTGVLQ